MKLFIFFLTLLLSTNLFSEIVTLKDGRKIDLKDDGTYIIISDAEKDVSSTQQTIISLLQLSDVDFEYELPEQENSIILKNLKWVDKDELHSIEVIEIFNLNEKYFNNFNINSFNKYEGKIFEKLIINNWKIDSTTENYSFEYIEVVNLDHLKINELNLNDFDDENYLSILDGLAVDEILFLNAFADDGEELIQFSGIVNDIEDLKIGIIQLEDMFFRNFEFDANVSQFKIEDFKLNKSTIEEIDWDNPTEDDFLEIFDSIGNVEMNNGEFIYNDINDLKIKFSKIQFGNFKMEYINESLFPTKGLIELIGLEIDTDDLTYDQIKKIIGSDQIKFNTLLDWEWHNTSDKLNTNLSFVLQNLFKLDFNSTFSNNESFDLNSKIENSEVKLNNFSINLNNYGLIENIYELLSFEQNISVSEYISNLIFQLQLFAIDAYIDEESFNELKIFLEKPQNLNISIQPFPPLSFVQIYNLFNNPDILIELLNIKIESN